MTERKARVQIRTASEAFADASPETPVSSGNRFARYREKIRRGELPMGSYHSSTVPRNAKERGRSARQLIGEFLRLLKPRMRTLIFALATATISTLLGLLPPAGTKLVIDNALGGQPLPPFLRGLSMMQTPLGILTSAVVFVTVVSTARIAIHLSGRWQATILTKRIQLDVRRRLFNHILRLPLHRVQELRSGAIASVLREDGGSVGDLVFGLLYNPWRAIIQLTGSLLILASVDWKLLLGALMLIPITYFSHRTWINNLRPQFLATRHQRAQTDAVAAEVFAGIRIVRAFSRQKRAAARYIKENNFLARQELFSWWWLRVVELFWELAFPIGSALLLFYGGHQVLNGTLTAGDVMMFMVYLLLLIEPLGTLSNGATAFQNSLSGLDRVLDLLAEPQEMAGDRNTMKMDPTRVDGKMEFRDVSFRYSETAELALEDLNLTVQAGQTVALVGPSGAGKTTLTNLVARFYNPTSGQILIDGQDLRDYDVESYRTILGVVEQDVFLFAGTVARNIAYSKRLATAAEIRAAADAANATEFIERLPDGFHTRIGERGFKLSGGQRQRLAIARAILADPTLLILDEATSNLDTESEQLIQRSLKRLTDKRTCFVIAHRLSTIADADLICVIENGRITQTGTHAELIQSGGRYRTMVEQQISLALGENPLTSLRPTEQELPAPHS